MKPTRLFPRALPAALILAAMSCGDPTATQVGAPGTPQGDLNLWQPLAGLLQCSALPADSVSETIGPDGGTLYVGPHTLSVPPGALVEPVTITAVAPSDSVNRIQFQPAGLTFSQPASLTMSYANCRAFGRWWPRRVAYTSDALQILEYIPSVDDWFSQEVTSQVEHFSTYAVAW